ncbi:Ribonuclease Rh [Smittium mucronatum]|uniref:ribonuclease T2 n=1 Tax=Smittium mucronatum TaxID=133383 RepID=A0A1R0H186_9FUNG|nr:Ribonuclease Rh [Smittium mucronatum]
MLAKSLFLAFTALVGAQKFAEVCTIPGPSCSVKNSTDTCCVSYYGTITFSHMWLANRGRPDQFTIHGMWPNRCDWSYLNEGCDLSRNYTGAGDIVKARNPSLYKTMLRDWPSSDGDFSSFWDHEWNKHGTCYDPAAPKCLADYQKYDDLLMYYEVTHQIYSKYNMYNILASSGIVPGFNYTRSSMEAAILKNSGLISKVRCDSAGNLSEIYSYFYISGQTDFIPTTPVYNPTDCLNIYYPKKSVSPKCQ